MLAQELSARLWRAVRRSAWRIARIGMLAALAAFVVGEIAGDLFNGGHFTVFVHLVSLFAAVLAAYGAALTTAIVEAVRGIFGAVTDIETDLRQSFGAGGSWQVVDAETPPKS